MGLLITFVLGLFILIGVFLVKISKNTKLIENLSSTWMYDFTCCF